MARGKLSPYGLIREVGANGLEPVTDVFDILPQCPICNEQAAPSLCTAPVSVFKTGTTSFLSKSWWGNDKPERSTAAYATVDIATPPAAKALWKLINSTEGELPGHIPSNAAARITLFRSLIFPRVKGVNNIE
jgi:hypothetical protein